MNFESAEAKNDSFLRRLSMSHYLTRSSTRAKREKLFGNDSKNFDR